jgi:hypothetical protein
MKKNILQLYNEYMLTSCLENSKLHVNCKFVDFQPTLVELAQIIITIISSIHTDVNKTYSICMH